MLRKLNAMTTLESFLIILLSVLVYIYFRQVDSHFFEKENYKTTARAAYTTLNKAMPNETGINSFEGHFSNEKDIVEYIGKSIKAVKYCNSAREELCWSPTWLWGSSEKPGSQLKSLQYLVVDFVSKDCAYNKNIPHTCAFIYLDSNGANLPNEVGKDILLFYMTKHGFIPAGTKNDAVTKREDCNLKTGKYNWGCTAKLLGLK